MSTATFSPWMSVSTKKAFIVHLSISLLIFMLMVATMVYWWFPGKLFFLDGGWQGLKLVAFIDIILGPALTLMLFKPNKRGLLMDMSIIALFQISALSYGIYTTHQQRTVAVVFADYTFNTLSAAASKEADQQLLKLEEQPQRIAQLDNSRPPLLFTPVPDKEHYIEYLQQTLNNYPEPHERSDLFKPMREADEKQRKYALTQEQLQKQGMHEAVIAALKQHHLSESDVEFHRFKARYASGIALLDPDKMQIIDYVSYDKKKAVTSNAQAADTTQAKGIEQETGQMQEANTLLSAEATED